MSTSPKTAHLFGAAVERIGRTALEEWRASVVYRRLMLRTSAPSALAARPRDLRTGDPERGRDILNGVFLLAGQELAVEPGTSPWRGASPSRRFAKRLHEFVWLRHLAALDTEEASETALRLWDDWVEIFDGGNVFSWSPDIAGPRLMNWLAASSMLFEDPDPVARSARFAVLAGQAEHVARCCGEAEAGRARFAARAAAALGAICLAWPPARRDRLLAELAAEADEQILSDGGHVSRCPESALECLLDLSLVEDALGQRGLDMPVRIIRVLSRLTPAIRFFRHGDGGLAAFNGGGEGDAETIESALARDEAGGGKVFSSAPASVFLRGEAGRSLLIFDGGGCPPPSFTSEAHAGALSFEFSHAGQRLIVNCGWAPNQPANWRAPVRATAAHSTLVAEETSSARLARGRLARRLLGARFASGASSLESRMRAEEQGRWMEAAHDGYRAAFGLVHRRRLYLSSSGDDLRGEDLLFRPADAREPPPAESVKYAIRFHLYPGLRVSLSRDETSALIAPPHGPGWRLRTDRGPLRLERSAYLAAGAPPRRSEQLVIYGAAKPSAGPEDDANRVRWALQRVGTYGA